jgi:hypothetical protein
MNMMRIRSASLRQQIEAVVEKVQAPALSEITSRLSNLQICGKSRRFVVSRMGSTGSTWLAKLLNSHPDVFCSHERILARTYPTRSYGNSEILQFMESLAWDDMHGAYSAIGDVGSVWAAHVANTGAFGTGILLSKRRSNNRPRSAA